MKTFLQKSTKEEREQLAALVESSVAYFYQIAGGHKKPGPKLCQRLVCADSRFNLNELRPDIWRPETSRHPKRKDSPR